MEEASANYSEEDVEMSEIENNESEVDIDTSYDYIPEEDYTSYEDHTMFLSKDKSIQRYGLPFRHTPQTINVILTWNNALFYVLPPNIEKIIKFTQRVRYRVFFPAQNSAPEGLTKKRYVLSSTASDMRKQFTISR